MKKEVRVRAGVGLSLFSRSGGPSELSFGLVMGGSSRTATSQKRDELAP